MRLPARVLLVTGFSCWGGMMFAQTAPPPTPSPAVRGKTTIVNQQPRSVTQAEEPQKALSTETAPQPVAFESDIYCFGYLGDLSEAFPVRVTGAENLAEQTDFVTDDFLYVSGGVDKGLKAGGEFWIVTPEQEIFHPLTGKSMGRLYQYRGRAVVHSVEARTGIVRVTHTCTDIPIGSYLKPFEPVPIPLARKSPPAVLGDPPSGKPKGRIVFTRDGVVALGTGNVLIVDLGASSGVGARGFPDDLPLRGRRGIRRPADRILLGQPASARRRRRAAHLPRRGRGAGRGGPVVDRARHRRFPSGPGRGRSRAEVAPAAGRRRIPSRRGEDFSRTASRVVGCRLSVFRTSNPEHRKTSTALEEDSRSIRSGGSNA